MFEIKNRWSHTVIVFKSETAASAREAVIEAIGARAKRAIYLASAGRSPYFYGGNEAALADIKRCAEEAAAPAGA